MIPKVNPRQMKRMMKQMGMEMDEVEATKVTIETPAGRIIIDEPNVVVVKAMGQKTYQITGKERTEEKEGGIPQADINLVAEQAGVSVERAREALEKSGGDLAEAILMLTKEK